MTVSTLIWLSLAGVALFMAASALALRHYTRFADRARGPHSFTLPRTGQATRLEHLVDRALDGKQGQSGIANLISGKDAFAARVQATRMAGRSLDLIYYIWSTDTAGWLLMKELMDAADRGVRVRLLLDDVNVQGLDLAFLSLNQHRNIEVRLFNPVLTRLPSWRRTAEYLLGLSRLNRRMHGKIWIADGALAILGGRNIGDTYFAVKSGGARPSHDVDVTLTGPLLAQANALFDTYWNMGNVLPILTLWPRLRLPMARFRRRMARRATSPLAARFLADALGGRDAAACLTAPLRFTTEATLLADPPEKVVGKRPTPWLSDHIGDLVRHSLTDLRLITPYFVPGPLGMKILADAAARGVRVRMLTNSLAATDLMSIHGAYTHYRPQVLAAGIDLYEFAPPHGRLRRGALLHSKVFVFDHDRAMVGSHNFDLRSANINLELGLAFRQPDLTAELIRLFDTQTRPETAFHVTLVNGRLSWGVRQGRLARLTRQEPGAILAKRLLSYIMARLPHDYL